MLSIDVSTSNHTGATATVATNTFSTSQGNELLLAFFMSNTGRDMDTVTGGGLTWTKVCNPSSGAGMAYIWRAYAPSVLTNVTVSGHIIGTTPVSSFITVLAFIGADSSGITGANTTNTQANGTPSASIVSTRPNSWVFACISDQTNNDTPTYGSSQVQTSLDVDAVNTVSHWVQQQTFTTPQVGTTVTMNDTAPTNIAFGMAVVEVLPLVTMPTQETIQQPIIAYDIQQV